MLTVPEQFLLLTLNSETGDFVKIPGEYSRAGFVGAALMELALAERIDSDVDRVWVNDPSVTGDASLDPVLSAMAKPNLPEGLERFIAHLIPLGDSVREAVIARLTDRGVLTRTEQRKFWVRSKTSFELTQGDEFAEMKTGLRDALLGTALPEPRDVCVMALAKACGLVQQIVAPAEMKAALERLEAFSKTELIGQNVRRYLYLFERDTGR